MAKCVHKSPELRKNGVFCISVSTFFESYHQVVGDLLDDSASKKWYLNLNRLLRPQQVALAWLSGP